MGRIIYPNLAPYQPGQATKGSTLGYTVASAAYLVEGIYGYAPTLTGSASSKTVTKNGYSGWKFAGASLFTDYLSYPSSGFADNLFNTTASTVHVLCATTLPGGGTIGVIGKNDNNVTAGWNIQVGSDGSIKIFKVNSIGNSTITTGTNAIADANMHLISVVQYAGDSPPIATSNYDVYVDGIKQTLTLTNGGSGSHGSDVGQNFLVGGVRFGAGKDYTGTIAAFSAIRRAQFQDEIRRVAASPHLMFLQTKDIYVAPSANVTLALTGNQATGSVGTVGVTFTIPTTGNVGTGSVGTVVANNTESPTGDVGTGSVGTVAPSMTLALSGNAGTSSVGSVTPGESETPTGDVGTGSVGSVGVQNTVALTGNQATTAVGNVTAPVPITGNGATSSVGSVTPSTSVAITGNVGTSSVGSLTVQNTNSISGNQANTTVGNVGAQGIENPTGDVGTGSVGSVTPSTNIALSGVQGNSAVGSVIEGEVATITGVQANTAVGNTGAGITVALSGNQATTSVGTVAQVTGLLGNAAISFLNSIGVNATQVITGNQANTAVGQPLPVAPETAKDKGGRVDIIEYPDQAIAIVRTMTEL